MRPDPLTPPEADLRDFPFMPILIHRLKRSRAWLLCKRRPELAFYLLNTWTEAWHCKPAGSLENDDMVLADAAMCDEETFASLRADIMRGWIECSDDRLYHPVVAEQANEAWTRKCAQRARTGAATAARLSRQKERHVSRYEQRDDHATFTKGQGQGQGQRKEEERGDAPQPPSSKPIREASTAKPKRTARSALAKANTLWPEGLKLDADMALYAERAGFDPGWLFERFETKARAKGWTYRDWRAAFRNFASTERQYAPATGPRTNGAWRPPDC